MPSLSSQDITRITDYVAGELTSEELARTEQWIAEDGERMWLAESLRQSRGILREEWVAGVDVDRNVRALMAEVAGRKGAGRNLDRAKMQVGRSVMPIFSTQTLRGWVGGVGVIAGFALVIGLIQGRMSPELSTTQTYTTDATHTASLTLRDGTRVTLTHNTMLQLVDFNPSSRTVMVEGEAYFDVVRSSGAPFVVRSGAVATQVLGTEFLVRHGAGDGTVRVAVAGGKVRVTTQARPNTAITLSAGEVGDITDSTVYVNSISDIAPGAKWAPGQLLFRHTPVATVLQMISRWYGYQFRYADRTLSERNVSIGISTQSSAEALAAIERVLAVNLTIVGDTVTLIPQSIHPIRGMPRVRTYDVWTSTREVGR